VTPATPLQSGPLCYFLLHWPLHPEDGSSINLWNDGILPQYYTESQPRRPQLLQTTYHLYTHMVVTNYKALYTLFIFHVPD